MKRNWKKKLIKIIPVLFIMFLLFGCTPAEEVKKSKNEDNKIQIVATTTMIRDLIAVIGGNQVEVKGLMGPGIDPHGYNATASDVDSMTSADIVAYNGMELEGQMGDVFSELDRIDKEVFVLESIIPESSVLESQDEGLAVDPHIWFSVPLWKMSADYVEESLKTYDPENASYYEENNSAYQKELDDLDVYIRERVEEVPEESRFLITAHDAFSYFGAEYGFEVVGLQGLNTQTEAGTRDVSELADFIVERKIRAIYIESSVPTKTIESLQEAVSQKGWEVAIGGELFSDALGDESQDAETYLKMYRQNIDTIVDSLKE